MYEPDYLADGIEPLTRAERAWVRDLEKLLKRMPERLLIVECADSLMIVDRPHSSVDLEDGKAGKNGVVLCHLDEGHGAVTGVSG